MFGPNLLPRYHIGLKELKAAMFSYEFLQYLALPNTPFQSIKRAFINHFRLKKLEEAILFLEPLLEVSLEA